METYSRCQDKDEKQKQLNLITHFNVQTACEHDWHALATAITETRARGIDPEKLLADTFYWSINFCYLKI